ncbi:hypothetical protein SDC9_177872 [bioreactor metagenome]|uniref:Uncharacterized protein n=1 Tax=bioreactor metagenome TaxID=1076179 RepID=A0A645GU63_9ZZZZ
MMKDIVITSKRIKKETLILLFCFITAFLINVATIIIYKTPWIEVVTQIGYVIVITIVLYVIVALLRILSWWLLKLFEIIKNRKKRLENS